MKMELKDIVYLMKRQTKYTQAETLNLLRQILIQFKALIYQSLIIIILVLIKVTGVNINLQEIALQEKSQRVADTEMDKSNAVGTNEIVRGQVRADELITKSYEQQRLKRTRVMNKLIFNDDFVVNQAVLCNTVEQKQLVKLFAYIIQKNSNRL